jgi:hypothetical protein
LFFGAGIFTFSVPLKDIGTFCTRKCSNINFFGAKSAKSAPQSARSAESAQSAVGTSLFNKLGRVPCGVCDIALNNFALLQSCEKEFS